MAKDYVDELEEKFTLAYANKYSYDDLIKIRNKLIENNNDTKIIDNAIAVKKSNINNSVSKKTNELKKPKIGLFTILGALFSSSRSSKGNTSHSKDLASWEMQEMLNNNLEEHNFEEEIIDEDDFYSDDLD